MRNTIKSICKYSEICRQFEKSSFVCVSSTFMHKQCPRYNDINNNLIADLDTADITDSEYIKSKDVKPILNIKNNDMEINYE